MNDVRGLWALVAALSLANLTAIGLHWSGWSDLKGSLNQGTFSSMLPIFNTASEIAYGAVIASLAGFAVVQTALGSLTSNVLVNEAIAVTIMAGITGSAAGGAGAGAGHARQDLRGCGCGGRDHLNCCTAWPRLRVAASTRCRTTAP